MEIIQLYKTVRPDGGVTISPVSGDEPAGVRIIADEGMVVTKGDITATCVDTDTAEGWTEIPAPADPENPDEPPAPPTPTDEATSEDYEAALREMGVDV